MLYKRVRKFSDADSEIQEAMNLEELRISEYPPSPNPCKMMTDELRVQYDSLADTCLEEVVVKNLFSPNKTEKKSETIDDEENSGVSSSSDKFTPEEMTEFIFPPVLFRSTAGNTDPYGSLTLHRKSEKEDDYDSDDTCDDYVECGEKGLCKCQRMRGREYYKYYESTKERDHYTMYPLGRCKLPRGAVFHFTGAPDNMKREDVKDALVALGAKIEFVDYQSGSKEGWARLSFPHEARIIIKRMVDKKLNVAGADLDFRVLSGKDEKRYHKKTIEAIYQLQEKAKGLAKQLKKAGYSYVTKFNPDNDSCDDKEKENLSGCIN